MNRSDGVPGMLAGVVLGEIVRTPLAEVAGRTRPADTALLEMARVLAM
jgi:6-phosphofructokinase 1